MKKRATLPTRLAFRPVALAAAVLLGSGLPAQAQYYDYEGSVFTWPTDLIPGANLNLPTLDLRPNSLTVGAGATGSFSVWAGADMQAAAIYLGHNGNGVGTMVVQGQTEGTPISALVRLTGTDNRLGIGEWGTGTLTVSGGAIVDATLDTAGCGAASCRSFVGNGAGSTGTLTVTGSGSELRTLRSFTVGQTAVFTLANDGFDFGTPGGTTNASVSVQGGGSLRTERASIGVYTPSLSSLGTEKANGTVTVSGTGSQWIATHNSIDNQAAGITIGSGSGGTGVVTVSAGGKVLVDGTGGPGPNDFVNIGVNGGKGKVTVTGPGSAFDMVGVNTVLQVGRSGVTTVDLECLGSCFSVLAGASASALYLNVGRDGATGAILIDGVGSKLSQVGVGSNQSPNANGPAFANIGRDGGTGVMTVSGGAEWLISDGNADGRSSQNSPGFIVGRGANANGTLLIEGAGSKVEVTATTRTPASGERDNYNPFVGIGYDNAGTTSGAMTIRDGGKLLINGNALSTAANPNSSSLSVGGHFGGTGAGTVTVTGTGSQIIMSGRDTNIHVGRGASSQGTFSVLAGASASAVFMIVGREQGAGTLVLDGIGSTLTLTGEGIYSSGGPGPAQGLIGWGGNGTGTVSGGAVWQITDGYDTSATPGRGPGLWVGISAGAAAGNGTLEIKGAGSKVDIFSTPISPPPVGGDSFNAFAGVGVGAGSEGTIQISEGGKLLITGNAVSTPTFPRGTNLNIGGNSDTVYGGTGTVAVSGPGSELRVTGSDGFIAVGRNGTGTLALTDQALVESRNINVGRGRLDDVQFGDGTLTMDNSTLLLNGEQTGANPSGAALSIGNRGGVGRATLTNGSTVTITNLGTLGASLNLGGTTPNPFGTGELTMSGGSTISVIAASGLASMSVGRDGTGTASLTGTGTQIDIGNGTLHIGRLATGEGTVSIENGAKILTGITHIGGSSDAVAGGLGVVTVTGAGSELRASGPSGVVGAGRGGNGTLVVSDQGQITAIGAVVGRFAGGTGNLIAQNATLEFSGQQTTGTLSGAFLSIGSGGGNGLVALTNSTVTLTNAGSDGASINVGGSGNFPLGTGSLVMVDSSATLTAGAGLGNVSIGRNGTGTATLSNSTISNVGGNVYVARESGSTGTLALTNGSTLTAEFVGVGVSAAGTGAAIGAPGGVGTLALDGNSTVYTGRFELGANSFLVGNGTIDAEGDVVIAGTVSPGYSPGRIRIRCNIVVLPGGRIVLEISGSGDDFAGYEIDQLIIGDTASFDLGSADIVFSFLGDTNPNVVSAIGGLNLDYYLRAGSEDPSAPLDAPTLALSNLFQPGQGWSDVIDPTKVSAVSERYDVTSFSYTGGGTFELTAVPVPEPSTWGLMFAGLAAVGGWARRRKAQAAQA